MFFFRFDQQATEQFPPPPRLFRSRSDETLSHSEYSYHGRAFKSKEAAMEELKTLKHHEEVKYDTNTSKTFSVDSRIIGHYRLTQLELF